MSVYIAPGDHDVSFIGGDLNYATAVVKAVSYDNGSVTINNSGTTGDVHFSLLEGGRSPNGMVLSITFQVTGSSGASTNVWFTNGQVLSLSPWDQYSQNVLGGTTGGQVVVP